MWMSIYRRRETDRKRERGRFTAMLSNAYHESRERPVDYYSSTRPVAFQINSSEQSSAPAFFSIPITGDPFIYIFSGFQLQTNHQIQPADSSCSLISLKVKIHLKFIKVKEHLLRFNYTLGCTSE